MASSHSKPVILTLGVTGQLGKMVADHLVKEDSIALRVTSKKRGVAKAKRTIWRCCFHGPR